MADKIYNASTGSMPSADEMLQVMRDIRVVDFIPDNQIWMMNQRMLDELSRELMLPKELVSESSSPSYSSALIYGMRHQPLLTDYRAVVWNVEYDYSITVVREVPKPRTVLLVVIAFILVLYFLAMA